MTGSGESSFVIPRSATVLTVVLNVAVLLVLLGSVVVALTFAVSLRTVLLATLGLIIATMVTVRVAPAAKVPIGSVKDVPEPVPSLDETKVSPAGSVSDRLTPWASEGPALVKVSV